MVLFPAGERCNAQRMQNIGDKWYFLNVNKEGVPAGAMLKDTVQDGYTINAEGVRQ